MPLRYARAIKIVWCFFFFLVALVHLLRIPLLTNARTYLRWGYIENKFGMSKEYTSKSYKKSNKDRVLFFLIIKNLTYPSGPRGYSFNFFYFLIWFNIQTKTISLISSIFTKIKFNKSQSNKYLALWRKVQKCISDTIRVSSARIKVRLLADRIKD